MEIIYSTIDQCQVVIHVKALTKWNYMSLIAFIILSLLS